MRWLGPLVSVSLFALPACDLLTPKIDADLAGGLVESILTKEGLEPTSVSCPDNQKAEKGNVFECTADVKGVEVHFSMEVMDDKGTVYATPRDHTLVVERVEPEIAADLEAQGHSVGKVDCHGDVWVAIKGAEVSCDVTDEAGTEYLWTATFTDDDGGHEHSLQKK
ncbi:MAG: DUF4333 domain-containing protein [Nannocystaceae bacterium]|nr:DUF4333 domain-containing protein [bacterium]